MLTVDGPHQRYGGLASAYMLVFVFGFVPDSTASDVQVLLQRGTRVRWRDALARLGRDGVAA